MPYLKISSPSNQASKNKGSVKDLANYLEKENVDKDIDSKELFFNHSDSDVFIEEVINKIDNNKKGLKNSETKFYEMSISFSQRELQHIKELFPTEAGQRQAIQDYVRVSMDEYAKHFERGLGGNDLVYFGKIEHNRRYHPHTLDENLRRTYEINYSLKKEISDLKLKGADFNLITKFETQYIRDKQGTIILPGNHRPGDNRHVHIIISRRDRAQKISLSPMANSKGSQNKLNGREVKIGFDRDQYVQKIENAFDKQFLYTRNLGERYKDLHQAKVLKTKVNSLVQAIDDPERFAEKMAHKVVKDAIKKGISNYLQSNNMAHLVKPIQQMVASNRSSLVNLAASHLSKDLVTTSTIQTLATAIPVPAAMVIKAITVAYSLLSSDKSKSKSLSHGR